MNAIDALKTSLTQSEGIVQSYLADLSDEDLFVRPVEGINHIAWQLGHLISSEHSLMEQVCPGALPPLPEGFAEKHTSETAGSNDRNAFLSKEDYLRIHGQQRPATIAALESLSEEQLDQPSPEALQQLAPTVGAVFSLVSLHWLMHAGQWAVTRRKLGRPPLF